jgi:predicted DNA binding CopG/RHH family protein
MKKQYIYDSYEQQIIDSFENENWESVLTSKRRREIENAAANTIDKQTRAVHLHINEYDYQRIKIRAFKERLPLKLLMENVLSQYSNNRLVENAC